MCGIMGFINKDPKGELTDNQRMNILGLLEGISDRGLDASGIAIYHGGDSKHNDHYNASLFKWPRNSMDLADSKYLQRMLDRPVRALIGHARAATHGEPKNNMHNHPFVSRKGTVFLVHNGIIYNEGKSEVQDLLLGECDTEVLIRHIERYGIKQAFTNAASWHIPSYAVLMLYPPTNKFYFIRRDNPTVIADTALGVYFASTKEIVDYGMSGEVIKTVRTPAENTLYVYDIKEFIDDGIMVDTDPYEVVDLSGVTEKTYNGYGYYCRGAYKYKPKNKKKNTNTTKAAAAAYGIDGYAYGGDQWIS